MLSQGGGKHFAVMRLKKMKRWIVFWWGMLVALGVVAQDLEWPTGTVYYNLFPSVKCKTIQRVDFTHGDIQFKSNSASAWRLIGSVEFDTLGRPIHAKSEEFRAGKQTLAEMEWVYDETGCLTECNVARTGTAVHPAPKVDVSCSSGQVDHIVELYNFGTQQTRFFRDEMGQIVGKTVEQNFQGAKHSQDSTSYAYDYENRVDKIVMVVANGNKYEMREWLFKYDVGPDSLVVHETALSGAPSEIEVQFNPKGLPQQMTFVELNGGGARVAKRRATFVYTAR
jgi:hypothetical protein